MNEGCGKELYGKGHSLKRLRPFRQPPDCKIEIVCAHSLSKSPILSLLGHLFKRDGVAGAFLFQALLKACLAHSDTLISCLSAREQVSASILKSPRACRNAGVRIDGCSALLQAFYKNRCHGQKSLEKEGKGSFILDPCSDSTQTTTQTRCIVQALCSPGLFCFSFWC